MTQSALMKRVSCRNTSVCFSPQNEEEKELCDVNALCTLRFSSQVWTKTMIWGRREFHMNPSEWDSDSLVLTPPWTQRWCALTSHAARPYASQKLFEPFKITLSQSHSVLTFDLLLLNAVIVGLIRELGVKHTWCWTDRAVGFSFYLPV